MEDARPCVVLNSGMENKLRDNIKNYPKDSESGVNQYERDTIEKKLDDHEEEIETMHGVRVEVVEDDMELLVC